MNRRSLLKSIAALGAGLLAGLMPRAATPAAETPATERDLLTVAPHLRGRRLEDVIRTPGVLITGGSAFLQPGESAYDGLRSAVSPVPVGFARAHVRASVLPDGKQLVWRVFDLPIGA